MLKRSYDLTNVLVVEDQLSDAEIMRACLEEGSNGAFNVVHAPSMQAALPILAERNMHAVMLDLMLPDSDELDGLAGIHSVTPNMPVLIVTGRDDEEMANEAVAQGAQDYLLKDKINAPMLQRSLRRAIQRKHHEKTILQQAYFDRLSGLPNRELFMERLNVALARQQRSQQSLGLMMLDLNGFKAVNDGYGHDAGDLVIREIGRRIPLCLRPYDLAARLGGDEFTVLIEDGKLPCDYGSVARKLIEAIELPMIVAGEQMQVGVSIGIAVCDTVRATPPEILLREADMAMYWAKTKGASAYKFFKGPELQMPMRQRHH